MRPASRSTSAAGSRPTGTGAPMSTAFMRSATSSTDRCSPTRPRTKAWRLPRSIAGQQGHVNYGVIPAWSIPSRKSPRSGKTEEELKTAGIDYSCGKIPVLGQWPGPGDARDRRVRQGSRRQGDRPRARRSHPRLRRRRNDPRGSRADGIRRLVGRSWRAPAMPIRRCRKRCAKRRSGRSPSRFIFERAPRRPPLQEGAPG